MLGRPREKMVCSTLRRSTQSENGLEWNALRFLFLFIILSFPNYVLSHSMQKAPSLLIVSFDGFRWNYLNRTKTPNFDRVIREGVWARRGLKNIFGTQTLTNHWSMVTGLYAENHGIIDNEMYDPVLNKSFVPLYIDRFHHNDPRFYDVPGVQPIWVANQLQGKYGRSGSIMWWGAEYAIDSIRPTYHMPYDLETSGTDKIDTMIKWFTGKYPINLGLLYFSEPDHKAHKCGPESENVTEEIAYADHLTGYLLQQLEKVDMLDDINIIITSDHGFVSVSRDKLIMLDDFVDPTWFKVVHYTPVCAIIPNPGYEERVYEKLKSHAPSNHFQVYKRTEIPEELHYKNNVRVTPIIAVAELSYNFMVNMSREHFKMKGTHGYDNSLQEMHPFFMAMGPSFKPGFQLETFSSINIYALMCHLLHLEPASNNGSLNVVSQLLKEHETTVLTFTTYIICLIIIATIGGVFVVAACRQHHYLKRKQNQSRMSTVGPSKFNFLSFNGSKDKLLSGEEDDDDEDF